MMQFHLDVVTALARVRRGVQDEHIPLGTVLETVASAKDDINDLMTNDGPRLKQFKSRVTRADDGTVLYKGCQLARANEGEQTLAAERVTVKHCLVSRFRDFSTGPVLSKATILDVTNWPDDDQLLLSYKNE